MATINNNPTGQYNSPILSSTGVGSAYDDASRQLNDFTTGRDPYAQLFETMMANNQTVRDNAVATATADSQRQAQQLQQNETAYNAGLATEGVLSQANRYLPGYQAGLVEQAHQNYLGRYQAIDNAERLAIAAAETARIQGDVKTMQSKLEYLQQLRKAKADALEKAQQLEWEKNKFQQQMALQWHQENRLSNKKDPNNPDNEPRTQSEVFKPSPHQLRRLQNNDVPISAVNYFQSAISNGYTFDEAFNALDEDMKNMLSSKGRKLIKKFIQPL